MQDPWYVPFTSHCTSEFGSASGCWQKRLLAFTSSQANAPTKGSQAQDSPASTPALYSLPFSSKQSYLKKQEESFRESSLQQNARDELSIKVNNGEKPVVPSQLEDA